MTQTQQVIYNYITENQPICDHCIAEHFKKNQPQDANTVCRELQKLKYIDRSFKKGICIECNKNYKINSKKI
jgi:hypothetical protein